MLLNHNLLSLAIMVATTSGGSVLVLQWEAKQQWVLLKLHHVQMVPFSMGYLLFIYKIYFYVFIVNCMLSFYFTIIKRQ